jgi:rubrerythrin
MRLHLSGKGGSPARPSTRGTARIGPHSGGANFNQTSEAVMNIYEYAMRMEKDGEQYYRLLAEDSKTTGLRKIFTMLADEEVKHYKIIDRMARKSALTPFAETSILNGVKNVFQDMKDSRQELHIDSMAATESYRKACDLEEQSRIFYQEKAEEVGSDQARKIFLRLADEEQEHFRIMETLVEFVSRPEPGNWLENAEWTHLEAY